jgi:alginate O-acetyltransferase complex protein AlgI
VVFSSLTFLFFFLPAVIALYYLVPRRARNALLLAASLVFYLWGGGWLLAILIGSIAWNYAFGLMIDRYREAGQQSQSRRALAVAIVGNLAALAFFKYALFAGAQFNLFMGWLGAAPVPIPQIVLPIGISFYTFHALSYLIDTFRGTVRPMRDPLDFGLYICFFPQLIAGPIVRFHEIRDQLLSRTETSHRFARGIVRFGHGLAKKVLIADNVAPLVDAIFATPTAQLGAPVAALGAAAYAVQLYFDFSGYSDMALGLGLMFGIELPENFNRPYAARSITDFWRRWHMSLSRWFRDYLYIPLGGNRGTSAQTYRNLVIVFLLVGLWHGADWTFVLWGAYHGLLLIGERILGIGRDPARPGGQFAHLRTVLLVLAGWILFRSPDIGYAAGYAAAVLRPEFGVPLAVVAAATPFAVIALIVGATSLLLPAGWVTGVRLQREESSRAGALRAATVAIALPVACLAVIAGGFSPFLYFRF